MFATAEHTSEELQREAQVAEVLDLRLEEQLTMYHPDDLPFALEQLPDVFTRFRGKMEKRSEVRDPLCEPEAVKVPDGLSSDAAPTMAALRVEAKAPDARGVLPFHGGAKAAWKRLDHYFWETKKLRVYKKTRNGLLGADYSSKFSPWLALGCISPREIHAQVRAFEQDSREERGHLLAHLRAHLAGLFPLRGHALRQPHLPQARHQGRIAQVAAGPARLRGVVRGPDEVRFRQREHAGTRCDGLHVQPGPAKRGQLPRPRPRGGLAPRSQLVRAHAPRPRPGQQLRQLDLRGRCRQRPTSQPQIQHDRSGRALRRRRQVPQTLEPCDFGT